MKYKKIILGSIAVGTVTLVPIATIISCGSNKTNLKKIKKPTVAGGKISGISGHGTYIPISIPGVKVTPNFSAAVKNNSLSSGQSFNVTFKLEKGYSWMDSTTNTISLKYTVPNLTSEVVKPTITTAGGTFSGGEGIGIYNPPTLKGTNILVSKTTGLSNGDHIVLTYSLKPYYIWKDHTKKPIEIILVVKGLSVKVETPKNTDGSVSGVNGKGTFTAKDINGTTLKINEGQKTTNLSNGWWD